MHPSFHCLCLTLLSLSGVLTDFLGPSYPAPVDLSNSKSLVAAAWKNVTSTLQAYIKSDEQSSTSGLVAEIKNVTFSLGVFSLNDPGATDLQFHYTSPEIANAPNGTREVNENSIYRIASLTKVFTVLVGLLNLKPNDWERPLTDIFPTFVDFAEKNPGEDNPIYLTQWDKVTPSALAAQIAGVTRDVFPFGAGGYHTPDSSRTFLSRARPPTCQCERAGGRHTLHNSALIQWNCVYNSSIPYECRNPSTALRAMDYAWVRKQWLRVTRSHHNNHHG
jgi:hypothetical protein